MKRSSVLIAAAAGMILGGITLGGVATATTGPTISGTVIASQGTGTGAGGAWKVDGSAVTQPVSGTVNVTSPQPYSDECEYGAQALFAQCYISRPSNAIIVKDVSIYAAVPGSSDLDTCRVLIRGANSIVVTVSYIPMFKQGTNNFDYYTGNSQVDIAVPVGDDLGAECDGTMISAFTATFQGDVTS